MAGNTWAKARDKNERAICSALRATPWPPGDERRYIAATCPRVTVQPIEGATQHRDAWLPKAGTPDLLVGCDGVTHIIEVKNVEANARMSAKKVAGEFARHLRRWTMKVCTLLSADQHNWLSTWTGGPTHVVTTGREACAALGLCGQCGADDESGLCPGCAGQSPPGGR